ncbi:hypothetical protein [Variovorax sp. OV329]|uniref:hypothetical protein n=1 Tax=Variovorax sp. OV329 TaxID=1882825 RepID=UPI0008E1D00E|nr:hypothetical protein [Variovorax sp. OV329]SFL96416.1 hypothetical protein SAMN05444747_101487 [Variovorax sp. OV329]
MRALAGSELLMLWERGASRHALDRGALLAAAARPDWPVDAIADLPLGAVNKSLLELRAACFGSRIDGHADCPRCGQRLAFAVDAHELLASAPDDDSPTRREADVAGLRVRAPSLRDLAAVSAEADAEHAARQLLARCTLAGDAARLDDAARVAVEEKLDALDPHADLALALQCVACGHADLVQLDAGQLLWDEIEARAQALLHEVHRLASAYGWNESHILALTPARRASYLAMLGAA